jgi:hypothetical protein
MLQRHSTDLAPDPISFDVEQMLPLEVLRQVAWNEQVHYVI